MTPTKTTIKLLPSCGGGSAEELAVALGEIGRRGEAYGISDLLDSQVGIEQHLLRLTQTNMAY